MGMISFMCIIRSTLSMSRAVSPGSSIMLNAFMFSISMKSSSMKRPIVVTLNSNVFSFLLRMRISVMVASTRSREKM